MVESEMNYKTEILYDLNIKNDLFAKLEVVGDLKVGKTSIINRLTKNSFSEEYRPTKGYDFSTYLVKIEKTIIKFQIWDMCGEANYRSALMNLYRNAQVGVLVYSINDFETFKNLEEWITQLKNNAPDSKIILIGNKIDMEENREVSYEEGKELSEKHHLELFFEISAKEELESPNFMEEIASVLYKDYLSHKDESGSISTLQENSESVRLDNTNLVKKRGCCNG